MIINAALFDKHFHTQAALAAAIKLVSRTVATLDGDENKTAQVMSTLHCLSTVAETAAGDFADLTYWAQREGIESEVPQ